jgi:PAS domain S-box-containing protein
MIVGQRAGRLQHRGSPATGQGVAVMGTTQPLTAVTAVPLLSAAPGGDDELGRVLETMPAAFCFYDRQWRFQRVNATAEQLLGRPREEVLGRVLWELWPGAAGSVYERSFTAAVASGRPVTFEAAAVTGGDIWYEVRAWPAPDGLAVWWLDVSDRRRAQDAARRATDRLTLLAEVATELSGALDGESALGRLAPLVVPRLGDGCIVTVVDREGRARDVGCWHDDPARRDLLERYTRVRLDGLPLESPVGRALLAGGTATEPVPAVLDMMPPGPARDLLVELGFATALVLPLPAEDRTVGVLTVYLEPGRRVGEHDLAIAREVAGHAGRAIDRVHRQSQQAELAEALQRSLLTDPPAIPGATVVVRYVPAAEAARVGGDWYDAFLQRDGAPVLVIGDVVGHDTAAAAAMGQLRGLLRGIAHHSGAGPVEVLHGLDEAMRSMHTGTLATAVVARLEGCGGGRPGPAGARLRWANAGHPPPALVRADGTVALLTGAGPDLMLGVDAEAGRAEAAVALRPGDTVVLYTDGLVERRGRSLDDGLAALQRCLSRLAGRPLDRLCDELLERMLQGTPQDDVAVAAVTLGHPARTGGGRRGR